MTTATTPFDQPRDRLLRSRVRLFGNLLGEVLREQAGEGVLSAVENLRKGYIRLRRQSNPALHKRLSRLVDGLQPNELAYVIRAFNIYFSLVNIAEEAFQHQQRRRQEHAAGPLWTGSFTQTLREFHADDVSRDQLQELLEQALYLPVFTAHPTEAIRRTVMFALRRIFLTSEQLDDRRLSKGERADITADLKRQIQVLWKTDEVRLHKPTVEDEIRNGLYYFTESLFDAVPQTYRYLEKAINQVYGNDGAAATITVPGGLIRFGSWIGGDRDGNPYVKPETTRMALYMHNRQTLVAYLQRVKELGYRLTHSERLCSFSTTLLDSIKSDEEHFGEAFAGNPLLYSHEPYRRKLAFVQHRLRLNLQAVNARLENPDSDTTSRAVGYDSEQDLLQDLLLMRDSLIANGDTNLADDKLKDLIRLVETFGFFLMHLDIRQESTRHTEAISELCRVLHGDIDYDAMDEPGRQQFLSQALDAPPPAIVSVTDGYSWRNNEMAIISRSIR